MTVQGQEGPAPLKTEEVPVEEVAGSIAVGSGVEKELPPPPPPEETAKEVPTAEGAVDLEQVEQEVEEEIAAADARRAARKAKATELDEAIAASAAVRVERKAASRRLPRITIPLRKEPSSQMQRSVIPHPVVECPSTPKGTWHL